MNKAVFLDRDGVINEMLFNKDRNEFEPPYKPGDLKIFRGVLEALAEFQNRGYKLFLISNQPDYAKGKASLDDLKKVHAELDKILAGNRIFFDEYFYCYHHPEGVVPEYSIKCDCRKPGNKFVQKAIEDFKIDNSESWFIGDRDSDILCGQRSGLKTIWIKNDKPQKSEFTPDYVAEDLKEASEIIFSLK